MTRARSPSTSPTTPTTGAKDSIRRRVPGVADAAAQAVGRQRRDRRSELVWLTRQLQATGRLREHA
jgi:hypothetical protein